MKTTYPLSIIAVGSALILASCSKSNDTKGQQSATAPGSSAPAGKAEGGPEGFEGSIVTSGLYAATWTASPEAEHDPFNARGN